MVNYKVIIKNSVYKDFKKIPAKDVKKIITKVNALSTDPRPPGYEKLSKDNRYRIRYRFYRVLYSIHENILVIYVVKVVHRNKVYR